MFAISGAENEMAPQTHIATFAPIPSDVSWNFNAVVNVCYAKFLDSNKDGEVNPTADKEDSLRAFVRLCPKKQTADRIAYIMKDTPAFFNIKKDINVSTKNVGIVNALLNMQPPNCEKNNMSLLLNLR